MDDTAAARLERFSAGHQSNGDRVNGYVVTQLVNLIYFRRVRVIVPKSRSLCSDISISVGATRSADVNLAERYYYNATRVLRTMPGRGEFLIHM